MERLQFGRDSRYSALESAHHLARYLLVKNLCTGKRVLDAACGEGYGSYLMAGWGAERVDGIDISAAAIENAAKVFTHDNLHFIVGDCETLDRRLGHGQYDLVVSFETLEHVSDVQAYLQSLRAVTRDAGTIVISCPNDHWYYGDGGENVFHRRRLKMAEFKTLTQQVLGPVHSWHEGTFAIGFSILREGDHLPTSGNQSPQELMMSWRSVETSVFTPMQAESAPSQDDLSFFVGVWGSQEVPISLFSGYPVTMNLTRRPLFPKVGQWAIRVDEELERLRARESLLAEAWARVEELNEELSKKEILLHEAWASRDVLNAASQAKDAKLQEAWQQIDNLQAKVAKLSSTLR